MIAKINKKIRRYKNRWKNFWSSYMQTGGIRQNGLNFTPSGIKQMGKRFRRHRDKALRGKFNQAAYRKRIRQRLVNKFGNKCALCRQDFNIIELTIDHKKKLTEGGSHEMFNLQLLCRPCHDAKDFGGVVVPFLPPLIKPKPLKNVIGQVINF